MVVRDEEMPGHVRQVAESYRGKVESLSGQFLAFSRRDSDNALEFVGYRIELGHFGLDIRCGAHGYVDFTLQDYRVKEGISGIS